MKSIPVILILFLFITSCSKIHNIKNDLFYDQLTGKVSKVTMTFYNAIEKNGSVDKGKVQSRYIFDFNNDGNIMQQTEIVLLENGDSTKTQTSFTFNEKGRRISAKHSSNLTPYIYCSYDGNGRLSETRMFDDKKDTLISKTTFKYIDGNYSEQDDYHSSGKLLTKTLFKESNNLVTEVKKYNDKGALITENTFSYDEFGRILKRKDLGSKNIEFTFRYSTFDNQNNYRKCISYYNGKAVQIEERSIHY